MLKLKKTGLDVIISLLMIVALIAPAVMSANVEQVLAEVITGDGYSFDDETGVLTVTSNGGSHDWGFAISMSAVKEIKVKNTVTEIVYLAFYVCTDLEDVELSEGLEKIGGLAFGGDSSLKSISIPSTVTEISYNAFDGCTNLESITMNPVEPPENGGNVFKDVRFEELGTKIYVPAGSYDEYVEEWSEYADYIVPVHDHEWSDEWEMDEDCHWHNCIGEGDCDLIDVTDMYGYGEHEYDDEYDPYCNICGYERRVPDIGGYLFDEETGVLTVTSNAGTNNWRTFLSASSVKKIKVESTVTEFEYLAFAKCTNLEDVELSEGLEKIGGVAFGGDSSLKSISIPSTVTEIGYNAFDGCTNLESITLNSAIPPVIADDAFGDLDLGKIKIYVPEGSVDTYKEQWPEFAECITVKVVNNNPGAGNTYPVAAIYISVVMAVVCGIILCIRKKRRFE